MAGSGAQRAVEIRHQVMRLLEANRQPDQALAYAHLVALRLADPPVGGGGGMGSPTFTLTFAGFATGSGPVPAPTFTP